MSELGLTNDERRCMQLWFRQAIAQVERQEAAVKLASWFGGSDDSQHRRQAGLRRVRRVTQSLHNRENVLA